MNVMKKTLSVLIACFMLASPCAVTAEESTTETVEKNFEYYLTLSDYDVYVDYCNTFGFEAEETLPATEDLPQYILKFDCFKYILDVAGSGLTQEDAYQFETMPELFGMPEDWYEEAVLITEYEDGADYHSEQACVHVPTIMEAPLHTWAHVNYGVAYFYSGFDSDNIFNKYRMRLTLENSEFVKKYANVQYEYNGKQIYTDVREGFYSSDSSTDPIFGDINADNIVDATDAALLLEYAAAVGAGNADTLEAYLASKSAAE